jgi:transposase InsO family protein
MVLFLASLLRFFLRAFSSKGAILSENAVLKKENEILLRKVERKRVQFSFSDQVFFVVLNRAADIKHHLTLVKPETVLSWQRALIQRFWTFDHRLARRGRKPVDTEIKNLILSMKNDNLLWGVKRIQGELLKLDVSLSTKTIRKILQSFRRRGKIHKSLTWKKFLETQIQSIYAMDFLTVDTMLGKRFYVFAVISHKTREIVRFAMTENPTREFVRQQLILFSERMASTAYVIHDNAAMFNIDFLAYGLVSINTAVEAPDMNSIMERFFRTVRREAMDNFLLLSRDQIQGILGEYIAFYNTQRPHQGIRQQIPKPGEAERTRGPIRKSAVLGGLHHHYSRQAA